MNDNTQYDNLFHELRERAKELNCLYEVQELLINPGNGIDEICEGLLRVIPPGWQYPDICTASVTLFGKEYHKAGFTPTEWKQQAPITVQNEKVGEISVYYTEETPPLDEGPFLKEERKLIDTIAERLGMHLLHQQLKQVFKEQEKAGQKKKSEWAVILDMLRQTDPKLLIRLSRKMVNYLCWTGIKEAEPLLAQFSPTLHQGEALLDENRPYKRKSDSDLISLSYEIFNMAEKYLNEEKILDSIQKWTKEDRSGFLSKVLENMGSSLSTIHSVIERYHHVGQLSLELSEPRRKSLRVALIRRILTDQHGYIDIAKDFLDIESFNELLKRVIHPVGSHGLLGGKSAGLFLAREILKSYEGEFPSFGDIKTPKTWYVTSDGLLNFMDYNNLEEVMEQKYKDIGQVRLEYPYVVQVFKNSSFSPEIIKGLLMALEDFGEVPLIVRSSSLLEDRIGTAFAGKYKSLFIANQGSREKRLSDLMDAIAEIYASTFGPDPIEYRAENNLIDYYEEMGIMIQEVVGKKAGHYFLPAFAGVGFSRNEFRWSPRISREDGLVRLVPGLGTRAVDRINNDYPIMLSPGQPNLKVNVSLDEVIRYSPKFIDVINLDTGEFETITLEKIREFGSDYPIVHQVLSRITHQHLQITRPMGIDFKKDALAVTFDGLISRTDFVAQVKDILDVLEKQYGHPVDIEFAHDGKNLYILQCRTQSALMDHAPANLPAYVPEEKTLISANKFVSNGMIGNITHIVYVDPKKYGEITDVETLKRIGRVVGKLNRILPKRQFILIGPGRWGSRGDIKLGVNVTYSDINNTAMLVEIARKTGEYLPELSFGTHFFQDLVESNIKYLPLYPDEPENHFNEKMILQAPNLLTTFVPEAENLDEVIRVIDIPALSNGQVLQVLMNADLNSAVAIISDQTELEEDKLTALPGDALQKKDIHWQWRLRNVENIAAKLDKERFAVKGFYLFGSVKNATAGPASDIDVLVYFAGNQEQRKELMAWLEGWSLALSQINYLRTGFKTDGLLDVHIITDEDIRKRDSYAIKIGAISDPARPLPLGTALASK
jgi:pyruvate, water dikinase